MKSAYINHNKKITYFISLAVVFGFLLLIKNTKTVSAQSSIPMTVAPARQTINVDPGSTESFNITFFNQGENAISGNVRTVDFIVSDDNGSPLLLEGDHSMSTKYSGASWVILPFDRGVVASHSILKVQAQISVPQDAKPGGRYIAIYFEPTGTLPNPNIFENQKEGIQGISPRVVGLLYIRVNGPIEESALLKSFSTKRFIEFGPAEVIAEIINRGSYHITPKGQITLENWFGKTVDTFILDEKNIFPDVSRTFSASMGPKLMFGRYGATITAVYGEGNKVINQTIYFWAFPVRIVAIILLSVVIIILLVKIIWKNLKKGQTKLEQTLKEELSEVETLKEKYKDIISPDRKQ